MSSVLPPSGSIDDPASATATPPSATTALLGAGAVPSATPASPSPATGLPAPGIPAPAGPLPPANLSSRTARTVTLAEGSQVHRFHTAVDGDGNPYSPAYYDASTTGRLNAPDGSYGVLYVAHRPEGAFAESFLRQPGRTLLPDDLIGNKAYATFRATRDMNFIEFYGPGQPVLGATSEVTSGPLPYDLPQAWSAALHETFPSADGIAYMARHDNTELCYAVFSRAAGALETDTQIRDLHGWSDFYDLMEHYEVGLSP